MKTRKIISGIAGVALTLCLFNSCKKETAPAPNSSGKMGVKLTDAPGDFQQVNVDIKKVSVHMAGGSWIDLPTNAGVYNLLTLQNGIDTTLVNTSTLPAGQITQMRLLLGSNNTVMVDSAMYNLTVPSGSETGVKIIGNMVVHPSQTLIVTLDFDANASVILSGSTYQLKPVIKTL
ncbi:MAG: DUF4382 domain-containing protein [Bacteroidia bacterium]